MEASPSRHVDHHSPHRGSLWLVFGVSAAACIGLFFVPAFIIRPFTHQTSRGLALAMALRQSAPWATLVLSLICLLFALALWRTSNRWRKIVLSVVMLLVVFSAVMARLNYFEWMFHPIENAQFESASASKLDPGEMILAVRFGADARAYPISQMAYHHVLNDVVGGVPLVATY
jgi:hypothetical protein